MMALLLLSLQCLRNIVVGATILSTVQYSKRTETREQADSFCTFTEAVVDPFKSMHEELQALSGIACSEGIFFLEDRGFIHTQTEDLERFVAQLVVFDFPLNKLRDMALLLPSCP